VVTEEGPTCPVERVGAPPCVRPLSATVAVTPAGGGPGQEVVTGADGTADLRLAAGDYTVHPVSPGGGQSPPRPPPDQAATVGAGRTTTVTLVWDTGIR